MMKFFEYFFHINYFLINHFLINVFFINHFLINHFLLNNLELIYERFLSLNDHCVMPKSHGKTVSFEKLIQNSCFLLKRLFTEG